MTKDFVSGWYENPWLISSVGAPAHVVTYNSSADALSADGAVILGIKPYTWAGKPLATEVTISSIIRIPASEFTHTSVPAWGIFLMSDGVMWRPMGGQVIAEEWGTLAAPLASHSSISEAAFTLPGGTPIMPAGLILPGMSVEILAIFRDNGAHTGAGAINCRMGVSSSVLTNTVVGFASGSAGTNWDVQIRTEVRISTSTNGIYHNFTSTNGTTSATRVYDVTSTFDTSSAHRFSFSRANTVANPTDLIGYKIRLI